MTNRKAKITETMQGLTIEIPSKKNWMVLAFLTFWLCGWFAGEVFALTIVFGSIDTGFSFMVGFMLVWLTGWTFGGVMAFRHWLMMLVGREVIQFERGILTTYRKFDLFKGKKTYNIKDIRNFSVTSSANDFSLVFPQKRRLKLKSSEALKFDYNSETVFIANGIDETEVQFLLEDIKNRRFFRDEQFKNG